MAKHLFVATHAYSGGIDLLDSLTTHPKIFGYESKSVYTNALSLRTLQANISNRYQIKSIAPIFVDILTNNVQIQSESLYRNANFIYLIRQPLYPLSQLLTKMNTKSALNHYCFRLRKLCEMAKKTPKSVFLTFENLFSDNCHTVIEKHLRVTNIKILVNDNLPEIKIPKDILDRAQDSYERHLRYFRSLDLQFCH